MKKVLLFFVTVLLIFSNSVLAKHSTHSHCGCPSCRSHSHHRHSNYYSSGNTHPVYLINRDYKKQEVKFPNCDKHYAIEEITINTYSDGTRRTFTNNTIYNSDGSVLISDCQGVNHIIYDKQHYFIVYQSKGGKGWQIYNSEGEPVTIRKYSQMSVIKANRILVRYDKKYGVIDLAEKTIIPIKYKKFNEISDGIFLTKLNGYWGVLDINNNILINNDCEMIKPLYETLVIKRYGKYGLADLNGKILYEPKYKKIKRLGEYILVKDGKNYFVLDFEGQKVFDESYKYVRLERNRLKVKSSQKSWINIK